MHTIRLGRPWQRTIDGVQGAQRVDVPDVDFERDRDDQGHRSRIAYHRNFNCPTGLDESTQVWLLVDSFSANSMGVLLNGTQIYRTELIDPVRIDITSHLKQSNQLIVQLRGPNACLDGAVTLEIQ